MRILVVGGAGWFGSFYAKLLSQNGFDVSVSDADASAGKQFCQKNGLQWVEGNSSLKRFDTVIVSVPNDAAPSVIRELGPRLAKGTLLIDFCSVKANVVKELQRLSKLELQLASIHPMHGPRVKSIAGHPVVCITVKPGKKLDAIKDFFQKNDAQIISATAENHDRLLSVVQGLTHYSQFVSAAVLKELNVDIRDSMKFGSPNYHLFIDLMSRVILQNPELYAQIQLSNPCNERVWTAFKNQVNEFDKLCRKHNVKALEKKIIDSAKEFKGEDFFLLESDRAVNAINYFIQSIRHHIGKRFLLENMATGKFHYGTIEDLAGREIIMNERGRKMKITLNHARLTSKEEMQQWKQSNLKQMRLDYSFLVPKECSKQTIKACLSHFKECRMRVLDEYESEKLPKGRKSLTVRATFFEDDKPAEIDQKIRKTIKELGFSFR